jgi:hypothetical protein
MVPKHRGSKLLWSNLRTCPTVFLYRLRKRGCSQHMNSGSPKYYAEMLGYQSNTMLYLEAFDYGRRKLRIN